MRATIWLLALLATGGAVLSIDRVLRDRTAEGDLRTAQAVILPPSAASPPASGAQNENLAGTQNLPGTLETVARNVAALTESTGVGGAVPRDAAGRAETGRNESAPAFDIARVEPSGDAVIAGRASPGATVELLRNGVVHDRVVADASGQFAMVPPRLPTGDSELTLRSQPAGGAAATSKQSVVVAVQPNLKDQPVVALMTPDQPSVVLSKPEGPAASGGAVIVEAVEAEPSGKKLYVSGRSAPRASVRLYLNESYQGATVADASGRFTFTALRDNVGPANGYRVRLDEVDRGSGAVRSRAEVPFTPPPVVAAVSPPGVDVPALGSAASPARTPARTVARTPAGTQVDSGGAAALPRGATTVVSRGDTLWRLSSKAYGNGGRYMVIYDANHNQIRNPDRIYPGQVLIIPGRAAQR
jgi:LysM domain